MLRELNQGKAQLMCVWVKHFFAAEVQRTGRTGMSFLIQGSHVTELEVTKKNVHFSSPVVEDQNSKRKNHEIKKVATREPRPILKSQYRPFLTTQLHRDHDSDCDVKVCPPTNKVSDQKPQHSDLRSSAHNREGDSASGKSSHRDRRQSGHTQDRHSATVPSAIGNSRQQARRQSSHAKARPSSSTPRENLSRRPSTGPIRT
jgi:hypothetical protein